MKLPTPLEAAARVDEAHAVASGLGLDEVAALLRSMARGSSGTVTPPTGVIYIRRPEYITAWLFDRLSTMPIWLIPNYQSRPLPNEKIGHYATAIDGVFWRWFDPAKFEEMFTGVAQLQLDRQALYDQNWKDAEEFCIGSFGYFVEDVSDYVKIISELMQHATDRALAVPSTDREGK